MSTWKLTIISSKEEGVKGREDIIPPPHQIEGELLIVNEDLLSEKGIMDRNGMYLSLFYCLCYTEERSMYVSEEKLGV